MFVLYQKTPKTLLFEALPSGVDEIALWYSLASETGQKTETGSVIGNLQEKLHGFYFECVYVWKG